jgi:hypothetical protein
VRDAPSLSVLLLRTLPRWVRERALGSASDIRQANAWRRVREELPQPSSPISRHLGGGGNLLGRLDVLRKRGRVSRRTSHPPERILVKMVARLDPPFNLKNRILLVSKRTVIVQAELSVYSSVRKVSFKKGAEMIPAVDEPGVAFTVKRRASGSAAPVANATCPRGIASVWKTVFVAGSHSQSENVQAIHSQPRAQGIDHHAHVGHEPHDVDSQGVRTPRLPRAALIPVADHDICFEVQPPLQCARLVDQRKAGPLLHDQQDAPRAQVAAEKHRFGRSIDVERFERVDASRGHRVIFRGVSNAWWNISRSVEFRKPGP